jgi:hypothetical protein
MKKKYNKRKKYAKGQTVRGGLATREQETSKRKVKRPKPPVQESRKAVTPVSQNKLKSKIIPTSNEGLGQISIDQNDRAIPTEDMSRLRTTEAFSPVQTLAKSYKETPIEMSAKEEDPPISIGGVGGGQGGPGEEEDRLKREEEERKKEEERKAAAAKAEQARLENLARESTEAAASSAEIERKTETPVQEDGTVFSTYQKDAALAAARKERIRETGLQTEAAARGEVPEGAKLKDAEQVGGIDPKTGEPIVRDQVDTGIREEDLTKVTTEGVKAVGDETVSTGTATTAATPKDITAGEITQDELDIVATDAKVDAATGTVADQAIAKAAGVERVNPIQGAEVEIPAGALAEKVTGVISEGAKATAVMNAGSSLSRITRAKKQLTRAGLSEEDITEIGNDPEALEDRLADFSEEQRGMIEGLPEEALVSTQLNGLLEGMENGEIPVWARPAVSQVEAMLAQRGMSASTVGRDNLFNAIIQSAMPIAQSNAQAIQQSVSQQKSIEAQEAEANAARGQQTALDNAGKVFNMNMAQFNADQQTELSNSKFMQTVGLTEANNEQQAAIQDAVLMSQANLAEADFYQKAQIQNAQAFLSMDMANLNNQQQANVLKAQQNQQRLLSNQSANNAAAQFNAASENQTQQFMSNLKAQTDQYNNSQKNAMEQFNATQENSAEARRAGREADLNKFDAQLLAQVDQFNSQQDFARASWNAQNSAAVEASNVAWRRQANTINTAAQNQINAQNAQNAFGMSMQSQSFLWQELRDQADFDFRAGENELNRQAQILSTAIANEGKAGEKYDDYLSGLINTLGGSYRSGLTGGYSGGSSNQGGTRAK